MENQNYIQKEPDEMWTSYLLRRFKSEELGGFGFIPETEGDLGEARVGVLVPVMRSVNIYVTRDLIGKTIPQSVLDGMNLPELPEILCEVKTYSEVSDLFCGDTGFVKEEVSIDDGNTGLIFSFSPGEKAYINLGDDSGVALFLPQYLSLEPCNSGKLVDDLVEFVKTGRKANELFRKKERGSENSRFRME